MPCRNGSCRNATIPHSGQDHMQYPWISLLGQCCLCYFNLSHWWHNSCGQIFLPNSHDRSWAGLPQHLMYSANCQYFSMNGLSLVSFGLVLSAEQEGSSGKPAACKALQNWWMGSSRVRLLSLKTLEKQREKLRSSNSSKRGQFEMHYMKTTGFQQCCFPAIILCQSVCWEEVTCYSFYLSFHLS